MPGILPMKVIKVGTNAQTRIAQACDRCRSKKIRCDGIRPCCSQCANVGFECKTSDKLSRRAFPRGYTESLEERVRILEAEVRELKELLDEKDEKIDMLSRIHSQSSQPIRRPSPRRPSTTSVDASNDRDESPAKEELFKVQQSPNLLAGEGSDSYFSGTSSGRTFIEAFKQKVQETGRSTADINTDLLLASSLQKLSDSPPASSAPVVWKAPPRLLSDQLVNIFFQEWAPLFPVLHRPTFLTLYEKYVADSDTVTDTANIAQLNLVFGIASLSSGARESADLQSFEVQWKAAVDAILTENTMATLQALVLAQIFCVLQGDLTRLLTYKGLSTTLSARLGLQQSQKRFALGTLTAETRKKVFWTLYTVDSFTSVLLGLPKHLKDEDIHCEYPVDADDEYVTERGFQPTLPGESTKLSSALALFRLARILSKVLEEVFPAKATYDLSLKTLSDLSEELDAWSNSLAPHLRLQFAQDKPSTGTISSRSPLLSMAYHYIRALIQRPAICATLGSRSSSHMIAMASSCKHMVQIIQLLEERGMSFAFCLSKDEILVLCGFGLLFQGLGLDPASKILKDNQKTIHTIIGILKKTKAPCTSEFKRVALSFLPSPVAKQVAQPPRHQSAPQPSKREGQPSLLRHSSDPAITINPAPSLPASTKRQLKAIAARFTTNMKMPVLDASDHPNGAFFDNICMHPHGLPSQSTPSLQPSPICNPAPTARSEPARSPVNMYSRPPSALTRPSAPPQFQPKPKPKAKVKPKTHCQKYPNLDYLPLGDEAEQQNDWRPTARTSQPVKPEPQPTDWEKLLGSLDNGTTNIYDACYGGPPIDALLDSPGLAMSHGNKSTTAVSDASLVWTADLWNLCQTETNTSNLSDSTTSSGSSGQTGSVLSLSTDDGKSSREDLTTVDWGPTSAPTIETPIGTAELFRGIVMPAGDLLVGEDVGFGSSSWDAAALGL